MSRFRQSSVRTPIPGELDEFELNELGSYNHRLSQGIVHTAEYAERMRVLQERFDRVERARFAARHSP